MENGMIKNLLVSYEGERLRIQETSGAVTIERMIAWLVKELNLPSENENGQRIKYILILRRTDATLPNRDRLITHDIKDQDELELIKEIQVMNESIQSRNSESRTALVESTKGELEERDALRVIERLGDRVIDSFNDSSERKDKAATALIGIDKNLLLVHLGINKYLVKRSRLYLDKSI